MRNMAALPKVSGDFDVETQEGMKAERLAAKEGDPPRDRGLHNPGNPGPPAPAPARHPRRPDWGTRRAATAQTLPSRGCSLTVPPGRHPAEIPPRPPLPKGGRGGFGRTVARRLSLYVKSIGVSS
jgi:hypothetical protein